MFKSDVFFLSLIISGLAMGWIGCALKAEAREKQYGNKPFRVDAPSR